MMDDEDDDQMHVNPCPPSWLSEEQKATLRGDCVEGTAYNERWVISTLTNILKGMQDLLPTLQQASNLTTYECTPRKMSSTDSPSATPLRYTSGAQSGASEEDEKSGCVTQEDDQMAAVVEIPSELENISCQLWDMCIDRNMALHLLGISDKLVLQLLSYALNDPTAPRITEILCGVVLNICCQPEGCEAVFNDTDLLLLLVSLPERTSDTPVLVQAFSLVYRLVSFCNDMARAPSTRTSDSSRPESVTSCVGEGLGELNINDSGEVRDSEEGTEASNAATCRTDDVFKSAANSETSVETSNSASQKASKAKKYMRTLVSVLHSSNLEQFISFIFLNSLNDNFIELSAKLLEKLVFLKDPLSDGVMMAHHYAHDSVMPGLLAVVSKWHRQCKEQGRSHENSFDDDDEDEFAISKVDATEETIKVTDTAHYCFICLYAFSDTQAADIMVANEESEGCLEPPLVYYITEMTSSVEEELRLHKSHDACERSDYLSVSAERLGCGVRLLTVLMRSIRLPDAMLDLARLLRLLDQSGVYSDTDMLEAAAEPCEPMEEETIDMLQTSKSSAEINAGTSKSRSSKTMHKSHEKANANKYQNILDKLDILAVEQYQIDTKNKMKKSARRRQKELEHERSIRRRHSSRNRRRSEILECSFEDVTLLKDSQEISCLSSDTLSELVDLRKSLEYYFAKVLHYWFTFGDIRSTEGVLCKLLTVLGQCHVPEVLLVFDSIKKFYPELVGKIQELLLDHEVFPRLVALLAQLYE